MSTGNQGVVGAMRVDLRRLHETWMELVYPRQRGAQDTVLGTWTPDSQLGMLLYRVWSALGMPIIAFIYPLVLVGTILRFQTRRIGGTATRLGLIGVVVLSLVVWGGLAALARFELDLVAGGFTAIAIAGGVATLSAALAVGFRSIGGRGTTVLFAFPLAVTAIFLPPVVAALFSTTVAQYVIPGSDALASWILLDLLGSNSIAQFLEAEFELEGPAYIIMWLGFSFPAGWLLGLLVTLADVVRPTE
ncbi:hypothetical protein ACFQJ5_07820 [Halomicroarcula sp. GCM10025324]|uniref:hypothetical protein n=1 Tax=Haloarcula TaxID=2237 RepID=UPI0023E8B4ED|nr:hypothetical protein [Halomicroarcula sp. ZS-22-S1]